ncbi:DinB family protein [Parafilimonas sp.]|uniref:DinB family protein n=1 Tax=Parafilimonas sp. TaxID=1969739 RepID=UPI0039E4A1AE
MTFIEFFKQQFAEEGATTRKMLSRVPEGKWDYKPHEKSMSMKQLTEHLADLPSWVSLVIKTNELDFEKPYPNPVVNTTKDLMEAFEKSYNDGLAALTPEAEKLLGGPWTLRSGAKIFSTDSKIDVIRMALSQQIHHRAQLGVYLRLLNIPIPGSYGPSADENFM